MKLNNIKLQFGDLHISIAQHYSKPDNLHSKPEVIVSEIALMDRIGNYNIVEFNSDIADFMAALGKVINAPKRKLGI